MEALAPYVRENTRLRTLVLRKTRLGPDGVHVLVDALKHNTMLTAMDVSDNMLEQRGARAVGAEAERERSGRVRIAPRVASHPRNSLAKAGSQ